MNYDEALAALERAAPLIEDGAKFNKKYGTDRWAELWNGIYREHKSAIRFLKKHHNEYREDKK